MICMTSRLNTLRGESFHKILDIRKSLSIRSMAFALLPLAITMLTTKQSVLCIIAEF